MNADALSRPPTKIRGVCGCQNCSDCGPKIIRAAMIETRATRARQAREKGVEEAEELISDEGFISEEDEEVEYTVPEFPQSLMQKEQEDDKDLAKLRELLDTGAPKPEPNEILGYSEELGTYLNYYPELLVVNGVIMMKWVHKAGHVYYRALVPEPLRYKFFEAFHGGPLAGHYGINSVGKRLKQRYYWPGMDNDVKRWVNACNVCRCRKHKLEHQKVSPLKKELHGHRWSRLSADIIGPFDTSLRGNKFVLVVIDSFTKWTEAYALPDHTAPTCAWALVSNWFALHGTPHSIQTDGGAEFMSQIFEELASIYGVEKLKTNPYRPQSNGMVERMNRVLRQQLSCVVKEEESDRWDDMVPLVMSSYRACIHNSTGMTPFYMVYGEEMRMPADIKYGVAPNGLDFPCAAAYAEGIKRKLRKAWAYARVQMGKTAVTQKEYYDRRARPRQFEVGDVVCRFCPPKAHKKFGAKWDGPYSIKRHVAGDCYELQAANGSFYYNGNLLQHVLTRNGMIKCINLPKAPEFKAQLRDGIELLILDKKGRIFPGKDAPQAFKEKFAGFVSNPPRKRTRTKYVPITLDENTGSRPPNGSGNSRGRKGRKGKGRKRKSLPKQTGTQREVG